MNGTVLVSAEGRRVMPAATHVDGTTRPQTLPDDDQGVAAALLRELDRQGAEPVLVNTSFNGPGEPIVNSGRDAATDFVSMGLDFLVLDDLLITRREDG
jgi:carbamoyltransferase